ncbi:MAG: leucine--tRNA ligase, partial [Campylobacterota bacterium]|nr:leucine--tRNA ligase [Campylobacterota bacterium]
TARLFMMFAAPPTKELEWNDSAVEGAFRFIRKFYENSCKCEGSNASLMERLEHNSLSKDEKEARKKVYEALVKADEVMNKTFAFNTLIASCMEALNALNKQDNPTIYLEGYYIMSNILEPIIPHTCWELSEKLFARENFDNILVVKDEVFVQDSIVLAVTVNGKKRGEIEVSPDASKEEILSMAKNNENTKKWCEGKEIIKEIVVPNKLVNIVVKG